MRKVTYLRVFHNHSHFLQCPEECLLVNMASIMKVEVLEGLHEDSILGGMRVGLGRELHLQLVLKT